MVVRIVSKMTQKLLIKPPPNLIESLRGDPDERTDLGLFKVAGIDE